MLLRGPAAMLAIFFKEMYFKASTTALISEASSDIWADAKLRKFRTREIQEFCEQIQSFSRECKALKYNFSSHLIFFPITILLGAPYHTSSQNRPQWFVHEIEPGSTHIDLIAVYHMAVIWCGHFYNCLVKFKRWNPVILNRNPGD